MVLEKSEGQVLSIDSYMIHTTTGKMKDNSLNHKLHLLWRAGFGPSYLQIKDLNKMSLKELFQSISGLDPFQRINYVDEQVSEVYSEQEGDNAERRKAQQRRNRKQNLDLNLDFLDRMVHSKNQLREKMAFFWHGHFACRTVNPKYNRQLLNSIRRNALGNFKDLLFDVSQSPAMLSFLNNQQNKKGHPNENFAREVMELFTMGRGNYSEKDVREAARAFTGWAFDRDGKFVERKNQHDTNEKTFLGESGNFDGSDILEIILSKKETAKFITQKIYRFFVNDQLDDNRVDALSMEFYNSNYDIMKLMKSIFNSDWFYETKNIGNRIKSPIELLAGMMRFLPMTIERDESLVEYQRLLGQMLLYPPNVAGWPSGKSWIDSSTLMLRLQIPQIWSGLRPMDYEAREDDDLDMGLNNKGNPLNRQFKDPKIVIDWAKVEGSFKNSEIADYLIQTNDKSILKLTDRFSSDSLKSKVINLMSTPEYQLM